MNTNKRKLPIGIQTYSEIRENHAYKKNKPELKP